MKNALKLTTISRQILFLIAVWPSLALAQAPQPNFYQRAIYTEHTMDALQAKATPGVILNLQALVDDYDRRKAQGAPPTSASMSKLLNDGDDHMKELSALADSAKNYKPLGGAADFLSTTGDLIAGLPSEHAEVAGKLLSATVTLEGAVETSVLGGSAQTNSQAEVVNSVDFFNQNGRLTLYAALDRAGNDPAFKAALDGYLVKYTSVTTDTSAEQILANNKLLATRMLTDDNNVKLKQVIEDLSKCATQGDVEKLLRQNEQIGTDSAQSAKTLLGIVQGIKDAATSEAQRQKLEKQLAKEKQDFDRNISDAKAATYVLSTVIGFASPRLSKLFFGVATAGVNISNAIGKFALDPNPSAVLLTSDILGAAMQLSSLFGSDQTELQMITSQLKEIREALTQLEAEMKDRFDRVDTELNEIYTTLIAQTNILAGDLQNTRNQVDRAFHSIVQLQTQLGRAQFDIDQKLIALAADVKNGRASDCLLYARRTSGGANSVPKFDFYYNCLSQFHAWSTISSRSEAFSGESASIATENDLRNSSVELELSNPVEHLATLQRAFSILTPTKKFSADVPNPDVWKLGADSYVSFLTDWRNTFNAQDYHPAADLREIQHVGVDLVNSIARLSRDPNGSPDSSIPSALIKFYAEATDGLAKTVMMPEEEYRTKFGIRGSFDLWSGPRQSYDAQPGNNIAVNDRGYSNLSLPPMVIKRVLPSEFVIAEQLGLGSISFKWAAWPQVSSNFPPSPSCIYIMSVFTFNQISVQNWLQSWPSKDDFRSPFSQQWTLCGVLELGSTPSPSDADYLAATQHAIDNWTSGANLASRFANEATPQETAGASEAQKAFNVAVPLERFREILELALLYQRQSLVEILEQRFNSPDANIEIAASKVRIARLLSRDFGIVSFPISVSTDDTFHSLVLGETSAESADDLLSKYKVALASIPRASVKTEFADFASRQAKYSQLLGEYVTAAGTAFRTHKPLDQTVLRNFTEWANTQTDYSGSDIAIVLHRINRAAQQRLESAMQKMEERAKSSPEILPEVQASMTELGLISSEYK